MQKISVGSAKVWACKKKAAQGPNLPNLSKRPNPLVSGNLVVASYFSSRDIFAADKRSGTLVWSTDLEDYTGVAPSKHGAHLFTATSGAIFGLYIKDGSVLWKHKVPAKSDAFNSATTDAIWHQGLVYYGDQNGNLRGLDPKSGKIILEASIGCEVLSSPIFHKDVAYIATSDSKLHAISLKSRKFLWSTPLPEPMRPVKMLRASVLLKGSCHAMRVGTDGTILENHKFAKLRDAQFFQGSLYCLVSEGPIDQDQVKPPKCFLVEYKKSKFQRKLQLDKLPLALCTGRSSEEIIIAGMGSMDFFSIPKKAVICRITSTMPDLPTFDSGRLFVSSTNYELLALKIPKGRSLIS